MYEKVTSKTDHDSALVTSTTDKSEKKENISGKLCFCLILHFVYFFLAHLSTECSRWAIVIGLCPSSVIRPLSTFALNNSSPKLLERF